MNGPVNPIDNLRDIHLPADPGWWPPAIGWWIVAAIVLALVITAIKGTIRWYRKSDQIRYFRQNVASIEVDTLVTAEQKQHAVNEISKLVKQFCIHLFGRRAVAESHGTPLLALLDKLSSTNEFTDGRGRLLAEGGYRLDDKADVAALKRVVLDTLPRRSVLRTANRIRVDER